MATLAYVEIQDIRFTEKQLGNSLRISYTNGATAGSEAVSVARSASNWDITVQIEDAVSTAGEIIAAVNADQEAAALVTASLKSGGDAEAAQVTCKNATLSGGTAAVAASVTIDGCMVLTADATGTGGNSITFTLTGGATAGSEVVTVDTNDISVQIADGVSTYAQVKTALDNDVAAAALIAVSSNGVPLSTRKARVSAAPVAVSLSGGTAAVAASVVVQDLTFAKDVTGLSGNGDTISFTTGASAGAEVVSVSGSAVSIQIANGVSTATQIKAAFDASAAADGAAATGTITYGSPSNGDTVVVNGTVLTKAAAGGAAAFSTIGELEALIEALTGINASENGTVITITAAAKGTAGNAITLAKTGTALVLSGPTLTGGTDRWSCTISGTGSNAQVTVNDVAVSTGAVGDPVDYFIKNDSDQALTGSFVAFYLPIPAKRLEITNDETSGTKTVIVSFNGEDTDVTLTYGQSAEYAKEDTYFRVVWLKYGVGAPAYRLRAWL